MQSVGMSGRIMGRVNLCGASEIFTPILHRRDSSEYQNNNSSTDKGLHSPQSLIRINPGLFTDGYERFNCRTAVLCHQYFLNRPNKELNR